MQQFIWGVILGQIPVRDKWEEGWEEGEHSCQTDTSEATDDPMGNSGAKMAMQLSHFEAKQQGLFYPL